MTTTTDLIFVLTKSGVPQRLFWAKSPTIEHWAHLADRDPGRGDLSEWDAIPTTWKRGPAFCRSGMLVGATLDGDDLLVGGCRISTTEPCRRRLLPGKVKAIAALEASGMGMDEILSTLEGVHDMSQEPFAPDFVVENETAALAAAEAQGATATFVERGTLKTWRVSANGAKAKQRGSDVLIHRAGNLKSRTNKP